MSQGKRSLVLLGALIATGVLAPDALAIKDADNQGCWTKPTENNAPDKEVPGFLINLGPTGARAVLTDKTLVVRYLFKETPASGRLELGDVITGVFGKPFSAHTFGGGPHGYEGPLLEFGDAIEKAEGKDGKLVLNVTRGGKPLDVTINLEPIGAFSATFPMQCKKSELLRVRALKYLTDHPDALNVWQSHARAAVILALLASDDPGHQAAAKKLAVKWSGELPDAGTWTWNLSHQLITLSEYHLQTKDASVLPAIKVLVAFLEKAQYSGRILVWGPTGDKSLEKEDYTKVDALQQLYDGGFGHGPYVSGVGKNGYGPMQYTTLLAVIGKSFGDAARALKAAGLEDAATAAAMADYLDRQARRALAPLAALEKSGRWVQLKDRVEKARRSYAGVATFDDATRTWDATMQGKTGSAIFAADKLACDGYYGKALSALQPALASSEDARLATVAQAVAERIAAAATETVARWETLEKAGEWHALRKDVDGTQERFKGIASVDEKAKALDATLRSDAGRALIEAHRLLTEGAFGPALTALAPALAEAGLAAAAGALKARVQAAAEQAIGALEALEKEGRWQSLRDGMAKARSKMTGVRPYEERSKAWEEGFASPAGRALIAADQLVLQGYPGAALKALEPAIAASNSRAVTAKSRIEESAKAHLAPLAELEAKGDWYGLERGLSALRRKLAGVPAFDEKDTAWQAAFKADPAKSAIRAGSVFQQLREAAARAPNKALTKEVEAFAAQEGDSYYGRGAKDLLKSLPK
jgi:hypothetical protein